VLNFVKCYTIRRCTKDSGISVIMKRDMMSWACEGLAVVTVKDEENSELWSRWVKESRRSKGRWIYDIFHDMIEASVLNCCRKFKDSDWWWRITEVAKAIWRKLYQWWWWLFVKILIQLCRKSNNQNILNRQILHKNNYVKVFVSKNHIKTPKTACIRCMDACCHD